MNKKALFILAALVVLVPVTIWFFGDDELNEGARQWQVWHEARAGQPAEGFLYQLGLNAPPGMDPVSAGELWYRVFRENYAESNNPIYNTAEIPWAAERLATPETGQLNALIACATDPQTDCDGLDSLLAQHALLLQRFKAWPVEPGFERAAPDLALMPSMAVIVAASQLAWLEAEQAFQAGESERAAHLITAHTHKLRTYQDKADSLLQMVVAIRMISNQVDHLVELSNRGQLSALDLDLDHLLRDLDAPAEMLEQVMLGEFGLVFHLMDWIESNPEIVVSADWYDAWMIRLFYRKNMTINTSHDLYRWVAGLASPTDVSAISDGTKPGWVGPFSIRNYWSILHPTVLPNYEPFLIYVGRFHDLRAKLALARAYLSDPAIDDAALKRLVSINPYGHGHGVSLDQPNDRLCLGGPLEDQTGIRCVPVVAEKEPISSRPTEREL